MAINIGPTMAVGFSSVSALLCLIAYFIVNTKFEANDSSSGKSNSRYTEFCLIISIGISLVMAVSQFQHIHG